MPQDRIVVHGAREHNLKNIDVEIPRDKLVVITGLSGSGKSSLAFDTIYAEGQRRYVESLSAYARQFLGQMDKPDVDRIDGLSPAISIDQKGVSHNPRSTVGTVTEIWDYMRLLWARVGTPHCPKCGRPVKQQTVEQIVDSILALPDGSRIMILGPVVRHRKGEHQGVFEEARKGGFVRARVDGAVYPLEEAPELEKYKNHSIEIVVDRLVVRHDPPVMGDGQVPAPHHPSPHPQVGTRHHPDRNRIADSVETALRLGDGTVIVNDGQSDHLYSEQFACVYCGISLGEIEPRTFSFNSPHGACPTCTGLGTRLEVDPELVIPDLDLSLHDGAIAPWAAAATGGTYYAQLLESLAEHFGFSTRVPVRELKPEHLQVILYGTKDRIKIRHRNKQGATREWSTQFEGVVNNLARRHKESDSEFARFEIEKYMTHRPCPACKGARLKPEALAVTIAGNTIAQAAARSVELALGWFESLPDELTERERQIGRLVIREIVARLSFLNDVGLTYLTLDRAAATLSGGEAQRIRLATQIGSSLMGVLYILDEPSIGLHQRDNERLIATLERLRDIGNTVLVVEHDEDTMRAADHIIDIGPGAGVHGGRIVAQGTLTDIMRSRDSITGAYLRRERGVEVPARRRPGNGKQIVVKGASENNLKRIDVAFPLGTFIAVTGVSGSGKSTLVNEILYRRLAQAIYRAKEKPGRHEAVLGLEQLDKVVDIDQSPIGRTPRSNPATYTGTFTPIRELFAATPEAAIRGYQPGRFSFNVKGGRCEACQGEGIIKIEMQFLPDVYVPCEVCKGKRYNREALEIHYRDRTISDVLDMTVSEACEFFEPIPAIRNKLKTIEDVGLGYIKLGQPAPTLSGGEAQRVKLASELSKRATGRTMYILDEPTTGLHFADVERLLHVLQRLVDAGNTVVVIEHNLDVVKSADWIIDLGPEGGERGGYVIAEGTPERVADNPSSYTGHFLARVLRVPVRQTA